MLRLFACPSIYPNYLRRTQLLSLSVPWLVVVMISQTLMSTRKSLSVTMRWAPVSHVARLVKFGENLQIIKIDSILPLVLLCYGRDVGHRIDQCDGLSRSFFLFVSGLSWLLWSEALTCIIPFLFSFSVLIATHFNLHSRWCTHMEPR